MNPTQFQCPAQTASGKSACLRWNITSYSQSQINNQTTIYWATTIQGTAWTTLDAWSVDVAGYGGVNGSGGVRTPYVSRITGWTVGQQISSGATTLNNASDGTGAWSFWMRQLFYYSYSSSRWNGTSAQTVSGTFTSPQIARYPALTFNTVSSTLDTMTFGIGNSRPGTITQYQVQRVSDGTQVASGNISATSFSFTLTGLTPNTNYSGIYRVRAYANGGWGSWLTLTSSNAKTSTLPTFIATDFDTGSGTEIILSRINDFNSYRINIMNGSTIIIDRNSLTGSSNTITPSQNELNTILSLMPNGVKKELTVRVIITSSYGTYTLSDKTINVFIPFDQYNPTFDLSKVSYADINPISLALTGSSQKIIRGVSNIKFTIQPATANGYSTMASYNVISGTKANNTSHTGSNVDITLDAVDGASAVIQAIDSREKLTPITKAYSAYIDYVKPTLSSVSANRINGVGENLLFNISGLFYNWTGLEQSNNIQSIKYRYREVGGSWSSYILIGGITYAGNQYSVINQQSSGNRFDVSLEYQIEILVTDKLSSSFTILSIPSGKPLIWKDLETGYIGIGKKPDEKLDVDGNIKSKNIKTTGDVDIQGELKVAGNIIGEGFSIWTDIDLSFTQRTSSFGTSHINGITYGNELFVAVGNDGKLATSSDGINWTQRTSGFSSTISGVTYGNGLFVAVSLEGEIATSPDGINWTQRTSSFDTMPIFDVTYGNGLFVAVSAMGKLATSPNGITWTQRTSSFGFSIIHAVTYGNGLFVALGSDGKLATSSDGINWTQRTSSFGSTNTGAITYGNGLFVVVGMDGKLATSPNGITWTQRTSSFGFSIIHAVTYGNGLFVAGGSSGKLATSPNGITWTQRTSGFGSTVIADISYGDGLFVIVGNDGKLATSPVNAITPVEFYEVGDIYLNMSGNNPGNRFKGTWELIAKGRTLVGVDEGQTEFNVTGKTGGANTHTLSVNEIPSHTHTFNGFPHGNEVSWADPFRKLTYINQSSNPYPNQSGLNYTGGGQAHNNLQPYITCYIWQRVS